MSKATRQLRRVIPGLLLTVVPGPVLFACAASREATDSASAIQLLPGNATWGPNAALAGGAQMAVLAGKPQVAGLYAIRVRFPADLKVMPHSHPDDRIYTVIAGTWTIGLGTRFDAAQLDSFPPGSVYFLPAGTSHFHWARPGESVIQITGNGPTATRYVDPADDPRNR